MASSYSLASSLASTTNKTRSSRRNNKATTATTASSPPFPPVQALHLANTATITTPGSTSADSSGSAPGSADEMQPAAIAGIPNSSSSSGGGGFARCISSTSRPFKTFEQGGGEGLRSPPSASPSVSYNCLASLVAWDAVGGGGGGGGDHNGVNGDDPSALAPDIYYDNIPR